MPPSRAPLILTAVLVASLAAACDTPRPVEVRVGAKQLAGLYWEPSQRLSPAVLLLPGDGAERENWIPLGARLRREGYGVLVLNLAPDLSDREQTLAEVRAGFEFLRAQKKVDAARIGILGAESAAEAALFFAAREPLVRLVVMLSPTSNGDEIPTEAALSDYGFRPLLLLAAEEDVPAGRAAARLARSSLGGAVLHRYAGEAAPGAASPGLADPILDFLQARL